MPDAWRCRRPIRHQPFTAEVVKVKVRLGPASLPASVQDLTEFEDRPRSRLRMSWDGEATAPSRISRAPDAGLDTGFDLHEMLGAGAAPCGFRGGRRSCPGGRRRRIHEDRRHDRPCRLPRSHSRCRHPGAVVEDGDAGSLNPPTASGKAKPLPGGHRCLRCRMRRNWPLAAGVVSQAQHRSAKAAGMTVLVRTMPPGKCLPQG